ncbi:hypothetical protein C6P42_003841 [Pichia californica]|nr:hypothetical protein C6P42_003841 [[Candida] californica]
MQDLIRVSELQEETLHFLSQISGLSGYLSISFWLFAQIPQVIKNHSDKSVDGFSLGFLLCWFGGDFLNLISCLLNDAMVFQILLSGYYCIIDVILGCQYYYYKNMYHNPKSKWYHPPKKRYKHIHSPRMSLRDNLEVYGSIDNQMDQRNKDNNQQPQNHKSQLSHLNSNLNSNYKTTPRIHVKGVFKKQNTGITKLISSALLTGFTKVQGFPIPIHQSIIPSDQYFINEGDKKKENNSVIYKIIQFFITMNSLKLGKILAWSCTILYLISRIPQIYTNYKFKSTKGISLKLICFALFGNFFYSMSLLLCESSLIGGDISKEFWEAEISYFIGALGTVIFDFSVLVQWYIFDFKTKYKRTKSGKLRIISPKINISPSMAVNYNNNNNNINNEISRNISIRSNSFKRPDPINMMSMSVKSALSPNNIKKISEFTPLSPIDFLLDDYTATNDSGNNVPDNHNNNSNNKKKIAKSNKSSIHNPPIMKVASDNISSSTNKVNDSNNTNNKKKKKKNNNTGNTIKHEEDLNMSMDEDGE